MEKHYRPKLPELEEAKCTRCGACVKACPELVVELPAEGAVVFANPTRCTYCAACEESCPEGALHCPFVITWDSL